MCLSRSIGNWSHHDNITQVTGDRDESLQSLGVVAVIISNKKKRSHRAKVDFSLPRKKEAG